MPRGLVIALALLVACSVPTVVEGAADDETNEGCSRSVGADSVTIECADTPPRPTRPVGVVGAPVPCRWLPAMSASGWDPGAYGDIAQSGYVFFESASGEIGRRFPDGREEMVFNRVCPDGASGFTWVDTTVTVQDAIDDAIDRARRAVPSPRLDVSPLPEAGGVVNLGMWLALQGQDPVTVRAEAGLHWAEATVTLESSTWDMGNGDAVECDGAGVPIVDFDTPDEGPCGYTYRASSPEDDPYQLSVTATWQVTYQSSGGAGTAGSITRTATIDYDVDEIQTIGISN